jgi:hypothetical protein
MSVRTSQETRYVSTAKFNRLMLSGETVAFYCENHTDNINTLCGQNAETLYIRIHFVSHRDHTALSITETNRLMQFGEIIAVFDNHTEHINTLCGQNADTLYIRIQFVPHRKHITSPLQSPTG